jgi:ribonuclease Z
VPEEARASLRQAAPDFWRITWIGTGGYGSQPWLGMPCALVGIDRERCLFNAGDGALAQLDRFSSLRQLSAVFVTSCRSEFVAGLPTLLDRLAQTGALPLPCVYGPRGLNELVPHLAAISETGLVDVVWRELEDEQTVPLGAATISCRPAAVDTGPAAHVYRITEPERRGAFDTEALRQLGIEPGPLFKRLEEGHAVGDVTPEQVIGPSRPGRRIALAWTGRPSKVLREVAQGTQLFAVAAPFIDEREDLAREMGYCTGVEAATIASEAGADLLLLHHIGGSLAISYALAEAEQFHRNVTSPRIGESFMVPFPGETIVREQWKRLDSTPPRRPGVANTARARK